METYYIGDYLKLIELGFIENSYDFKYHFINNYNILAYSYITGQFNSYKDPNHFYRKIE